MNKYFATLLAGLLLSANLAYAAADIDINTPAIAALTSSMQARHGQLAPHFASGALGYGRNGTVELRDAGAVPLPQRGQVSSLVAADNQDRAALYREIAKANNHPEWEADIRQTFAKRWADRAPSGWWIQNAAGAWVKK